jgi:hypothetical protein
MVSHILRHGKKPYFENVDPGIMNKLTMAWGQAKIRDPNEDIQDLASLIENPNIFDFGEVYKFYFENDIYREDMETLLSLDNYNALYLECKPKKKYIEPYFRIMRDARDLEMIERVKAYMKTPHPRRKVVIITGYGHMPKLLEELTKEFKVTGMVL